jgi:hypothetical protein
MSPYLRTYSLRASAITHRAGQLEHVNALMSSASAHQFTVRFPAETTASKAPGLLLDFGREVAGRVLIKSACGCEARVLVSYLEADGTTGYFVSMAHGWSSGPASWLLQQLLGVKAIDPSFSRMQIRPELAGLKWIRGAVRVRASSASVQVEIPAGTAAILLLPACQ